MKLFVEEAGSIDVEAAVGRADTICTARIAYVEARAALARHRREGTIDGSALRQAAARFEADWARLTIIEITDSLVRVAAGLAERYALRAYDAVHLASALELSLAGVTTEFTSYDRVLNGAARRAGLRVPKIPI